MAQPPRSSDRDLPVTATETAVDVSPAPADPVTRSDPHAAGDLPRSDGPSGTQGSPGPEIDEAVLPPASPGYSLSPLDDKLHEQSPIDLPSLDTRSPSSDSLAAPTADAAPAGDALEQLLSADPLPPVADPQPPVADQPAAEPQPPVVDEPTPAAPPPPAGDPPPPAADQPAADPQPPAADHPAADPQPPAVDQPAAAPRAAADLQLAIEAEPRFEPFRGMQVYEPVSGVPAPVGPLVAVLRRPFLTLLPVLVLLVPALAFGLVRTPEWSARAQVLVGRVDVEAQAVPGFVAATQELAGTYARVVRTSVLAEQVADDLGVPVDSVAGRLSATPVPESSVIDILAFGSTQEEAVQLAAATSSALVSFVQVSTEAPERAQELLEAYGDAIRDQEQAEQRLAAAQAQLEADGSATTLEERIEAVSEAQGEVDQFVLRAEIAEEAYRNSQRGGSDRGIVQPIDEATSLGSDRNETLALLVVAALIVGALLGVSLVTALANRHLLARLRSPSPGPASVR